MNYLAHAYLSFGDPEILTGNLISDFVKGRKKFNYPPRILAGIDLHRSIDQFTDSHPATRQAAAVFKPAYGLYSGAFVDIVYDHFLALDLSAGGNGDFEGFTRTVYNEIHPFEKILPPAFRSIFPYMQKHNWLFNYQYGWGVEKAFEGLVHRAVYLSEAKTAYRLLDTHYSRLREAYRDFFPRLKEFSLEKFSDIH